MKKVITILLVSLTVQALGNLLDIFEQEEGHEPRVAVNCGHVPFHADLKTGKWVSDKNGLDVCDTNKEDVKRYCQKMYPKLNITNIVEANEKTLIKNWCKVGSEQCTTEKKVVPYRCLVDEYEADALMVPRGCKFHHLHDQDSCLTHDEWKVRAERFLARTNMELNEYGILLACGTDMFTGIEFVGCPKVHKKKSHKKNKHMKKNTHKKIDRAGLEAAIKKMQNFVPDRTEGCDRTMYESKRQKLEKGHQSKMAAVVDEWDEAERRYKKLKVKDSAAAQDKMIKTLKVFRDTLAVLEKEAKEERNRLKTEHAQCITTNINKQKRDSLIAYLAAVEEKPHTVKKILKTARLFFQASEHDRLHSLRHFQHVRKQNSALAKKMRANLLDHLHQLNEAVNASINLLNYLPNVAKQFGLKASKVFKSTQIPEIVTKEHKVHSLETAKDKIPHYVNKTKAEHAKEAEHMTKEHKVHSLETAKDKILDYVNKIKAEHAKEAEHDLDRGLVAETLNENNSKDKISAGTIYPTDLPTEVSTDQPTQQTTRPTKEEAADQYEELQGTKKAEDGKDQGEDTEGIPENEAMHRAPSKSVGGKATGDKADKPVDAKPVEHDYLFFKHPKSPAAFAAVIGLSCGALVIMLGSIVALVMRRNRANHSRVVIAEAEPEDQEHLVKMQKSGYENPTYKFFYY